MRYTKLSVTLDPKTAAELREVAGARGVSAFINEAVLRQLQARRVQRLLDEMDDEFGPVCEDVARDVEAVEWPAADGVADPR